jgi:hypothetical protein
MESYGVIRVIALFALALYAVSVRKRIKRKRKEELNDSLDNFKKDENGLYPWETHTDDSPESIPSDAKVFKEKNKIRRGRW